MFRTFLGFWFGFTPVESMEGFRLCYCLGARKVAKQSWPEADCNHRLPTRESGSLTTSRIIWDLVSRVSKVGYGDYKRASRGY